MEHLRYLEYQFLDENFADVHFIIKIDDAQTVKIPSHKVILAAGSLTFRNRFISNNDLNKIEIVNSTPAAFTEFLFTFYSSYPEKNFTVANIPAVLTLAKTFEVVHSIEAAERFLMKNLQPAQLCFGYSLAMEYTLHDLKLHCMKQINEKKRDVFGSHTFLECNQDVLRDILENQTVNQCDEIQTIWDACVNWAHNQCTLQSIDASNAGNWRKVLGTAFNPIQAILSKDGEFLDHVFTHYKELLESDENQNDLWTMCESIINDSKYETATILHVEKYQPEILEFARFRETILAPQTCPVDEEISIEIQSSKEIALNGIAFSTISGQPKGNLTVDRRSNKGITRLLDQSIVLQSKRIEPRNFFGIENVVLEPSERYTITVKLAKSVAYRQSRHIKNKYQGDDFVVSFKATSRRDIFSHFFFNENFM